LNANPLVLDPLAPIHNSQTGFYRLVPAFDRVIGLATDDRKQTEKLDATQKLHASVTARWDKDASYRPAALARYFKRIGDARAKDAAAADSSPIPTQPDPPA
jgi:hypothetical protein